MREDLYIRLCRIAGSDAVRQNEPMKAHTTFRVGGPADYYVIPHTIEETANIVTMLKQEEQPFLIIGNGSNLLVGDEGIRGTVVEVGKNLSKITVEGSRITAEAGVLLPALAKEAQGHGLSGLEFASGIPGTLGGAVTMNAGAYGGEMIQVIKNVTVLTEDGTLSVIPASGMKFAYRRSAVEEKGYVVMSAVLELKKGDTEQIREQMADFSRRRREKQPLEYPSAGSTFKRPEGNFAGKLIMEAGLSGCRIGGAEVSEKHCGFIINKEQATAKDILELIRHVQNVVKEKHGITLEPEVRILGDFGRR